MSDAEKTTEPTRCPTCGEMMPGPHDCDLAREARRVFEAAKRANDPETRLRLGDRALALAIDAERLP